MEQEELKSNAPAQLKPLLAKADEAVAVLSNRTGVKFAPIDIPISRRRQTFVVWFRVNFIFIFLAMNIWALRSWGSKYFLVYILFLAYKLGFQTFHRDGGLAIPWLRNSHIWQHYFDYFPLRVHKVADLDPSQKYIFGYHPHGIGAAGSWAFCATQDFERLFPRIDVRICTLKINFAMPFYSEFLSFMGVVDASKQSIDAHLSSGPGKGICLVIGGARESLEARTGDPVLFLKSRKGFVKVALSHGASLVPVFAFGENALFKQVPNPRGSTIRNLQERMRRAVGWTLPLFYGRGVFQYSFGIIPQRQPLNVVFGEPIRLPRVDYQDISAEMIEEYHSQYVQALQNLFDEYKDQFGEGEENMTFV